MALTIKYLSHLLKKSFIYIIIFLIIIIYALLIRQININENENEPDSISNIIQIQQKEMLQSLTKNSTIVDAVGEIFAGYLDATRNKKIYSGFHQFIINDDKKYSYINELDAYIKAIYKYHPFFEAYANSLNFKDFIIVEPNSQNVLYSLNFSSPLLEKPQTSFILKAIDDIQKFKTDSAIYESKNQKTGEQIIGGSIYFKNKRIGIIIAIIN